MDKPIKQWYITNRFV